MMDEQQTHLSQGEVSRMNYSEDLPKVDKDLFQLDSYLLLDETQAIDILGSKEQLIRILKFDLDKKIISNDVDLMRAAYEVGDWDKVQKLAHKIKAGALYIGAMRMKVACQYLERYWKVGRRDDLDKLYQQLLLVIDATQQEMKCVLEGQ